MLAVASACGSESGETGPAGGAGAAGGAVLPSEAAPALEWRSCGNLECAQILVPLDRNEPDGEKISMAINRVRGSIAGRRLGVLILNPGGPGMSGKALVELNAEVFRGLPFDVIGFDPRGVGDSTRLECAGEMAPAAPSSAGAPSFNGGPVELIEALREGSEACRQSAGELFDHLGSNAVVADIEQLRRALGVARINFYGISYGTRLGALYAQTYPDRVRTLVLDAPVAPVADIEALNSAQLDGTLSAHEALLEGCRSGELSCPEDSERLFGQLVDSAEESGARRAFVTGWAGLLAYPAGRDVLAAVLAQASEPAAQMADGMQAVLDQPVAELELFSGVNYAVNLTVHCADNAFEPPSLSEIEATLASYAERSELFALSATSGVCRGWQVPGDPAPDIEFSPASPPLIVGGTQDPLTPLPFAEALAEAIDGSVLLRSEHYGHGALSAAGQCFGEALGLYWGAGELPRRGTVCPAP